MKYIPLRSCMMKLCVSAFVILGTLNAVQAQDIHTPAEIIQIMSDSELSYELEVTEGNLSRTEYTRLNLNKYYQDESGESLELLKYEISDLDSASLAKAESYFAAEDYDNARKNYMEVADRSPHIGFVQVYIGQTYGIQKNWDEASKWYQKAIATNYIDYMAHWFYADVLLQKGEYKTATKEISIAFVLNRNNPRIKTALIRIYETAGLDYQEWDFTPNYRLEANSGKDATGDVKVVSTSDWFSYALTKAIWNYEPGYREKMTGSDEFTFNTLEERECILGILSANTNKKGKWKKNKKVPEFNYMYKAIDNKQLTEFILVDVWFRQYPLIAYTQDQEMIELLADYVLAVRGEKL